MFQEVSDVRRWFGIPLERRFKWYTTIITNVDVKWGWECGSKFRSISEKGSKSLDEGFWWWRIQSLWGEGTLTWRRAQTLCWKTWDEGFKAFGVKKEGPNVDQRLYMKDSRSLRWTRGQRLWSRTCDEGFKVFGMKTSHSLGWRVWKGSKALFKDLGWRVQSRWMKSSKTLF